MILTRVDNGLLVVRQADHGDQTGLFAKAWGNEDVAPVDARHDRAADLAARHHDDGWTLWERHPTIDPDTERPYQFLSLPPHEHLPLYRSAVQRAAQFDPLAGILISMHGAGIYNDRYGTFRLTERHFSLEEQSLVDEFLDDMQQLQNGLLAGIVHHAISRACDDPDIMALYLALQIWDRLSLQFAFRLAADALIGPLPVFACGRTTATELRCINDGRFALQIHPYPFEADETTFPLAACTVPDRPYRTPEEFLAEVADSTPTTLECVVRARPGTSAR